MVGLHYQPEAKEHVAREIAATAKDGDVIGAGSGSTVYLTLFELARRIREEHLHIEVIPCLSRNLDDLHTARHPTNYPLEQRPDWTFDGADEVDPQQNLIKGRGGAMFKEKLLIRSSRKTFIIIDPSKRVNQLGNKFPIPVEVFPDSLTYVEHELQRLGASEIVLRPAHGKDGPVFTENGNFILDTRFNYIDSSLEEQLKTITGVIESGLFIGYDVEVIMAE